MFEKVCEYIKDLEFRFTVFIDRIHIVNYSKIISLEDNIICLYGGGKRIIIKGNKLILNKLLDNEILIIGNVLSVEVFDE